MYKYINMNDEWKKWDSKTHKINSLTYKIEYHLLFSVSVKKNNIELISFLTKVHYTVANTVNIGLCLCIINIIICLYRCPYYLYHSMHSIILFYSLGLFKRYYIYMNPNAIIIRLRNNNYMLTYNIAFIPILR